MTTTAAATTMATVFQSPSLYLKVAEIILLIVAAATFFAWETVHWQYYVAGTIISAITTTVFFLLTHLLGHGPMIHKTFMEMGLSSYYAVALFICSIILMVKGIGTWIASGVFCLILALVYIADALYAIKMIGVTVSSFNNLPPTQPYPSYPANNNNTAASVSNPTYPEYPVNNPTLPTYPSA